MTAVRESPHIRSHSVIIASLALSLGALFALGLAWFMSSLITGSEMRLDSSSRAQMLDFVRIKRSESIQRKERKPARPPVNQAPEVPDTPRAADSSSGQVLTVSMPSAPTEVMTPGRGLMGLGSGEGNYLPIVKVAPVYPQRALARGIEGDCTVRYNVTPQGTTRNVEVVPGQCIDPVFHRPSIEAAKRFKYKPRVIDGVAVEVIGVYNVFHFLKDEG